MNCEIAVNCFQAQVAHNRRAIQRQCKYCTRLLYPVDVMKLLVPDSSFARARREMGFGSEALDLNVCLRMTSETENKKRRGKSLYRMNLKNEESCFRGCRVVTENRCRGSTSSADESQWPMILTLRNWSWFGGKGTGLCQHQVIAPMFQG